MTRTAWGSRLIWMVFRPVLFLILPVSLFASVTLTRSDSHTLVLRYEPGPVSVERLPMDGDGPPSCRVTFPDAEHLAEPGEPDLPAKVLRVGIPAEGEVKLSYGVGPVHRYDNFTVSEAVATGAFGKRQSSHFGQSVATDFSDWVRMGPVQRLRDVRFVELCVRPCTYDLEKHILTVADWIEVRVSFDQSQAQAQAEAKPSAYDVLDNVIARMLVNGEQAIGWKGRRETQTEVRGGNTTDSCSLTGVGFFGRAPYWVKVKVESTGVYRITGRELAKLGVHLAGIRPGSLALYTAGERMPNQPVSDTMVEVPIFVAGEEDGRFDLDDKVVFYGLGASRWSRGCSTYVTNLYTRYNVYWLCWGGRPGRRMMQGMGPETAGTRILWTGRDKLRREQDLECPARSGLLWIWRNLTKDSYRDRVQFDLDLAALHPVRFQRICGWLYSENSGNRLRTLVNGRSVGDFAFDATGPAYPFRFVIDTLLPANFSGNKLTLELSGEGQKQVYLDYLEVEYERMLSLYRGQLHFIASDTGRFRFSVKDVSGSAYVLDVTDRYEPRMSVDFEQAQDSLRFCYQVNRPTEFVVAAEKQLLTPAGMSLRRPGSLAAPMRQADYWAVVPAEYLPAGQKLARYRAGNVAGVPNCRTDVAVLEDIYDDYGFGLEEPIAIKRFFADKRPAFGVLCGDATYDYRDNLKRRPAPGVPAYETGFGLDPSGTQGLLTLSYDSWYADFEGTGMSPDMILGRVTCRSGAELARFVEKLIAYERGPAGAWNRRLLLLADDEWQGLGRPDPIAFGHIRQAEGVSVYPGNLMDPVKVYLTEYPFTGVKRKEQGDRDLLRELNRGALAWVFFGHGDAFDLCHGSVFDVSKVDEVDNGTRSPFCYFGSCSVGRFEDTRYECIAEELVRKPTGGAIATVGATKATASGVNEVFARNLFVPLFRDSAPDSVVGTAFFSAWPTNRIYHLFGDPATRFRRPARSKQPLAVRPDTLQPGAVIRARTILESRQGQFSWTVFGPKRWRKYSSERGATDYSLPGLELARGSERLRSGVIDFRAMFPFGVSLDTVYAGNGFYAPVYKTCRVSVSAGGPEGDITTLADTLLWRSDPAPSQDRSGPRVSFFYAGKRLESGSVVPASFVLEGVISDSSGVLVCPVSGYEPVFFTSARQNETGLADVLVFDEGSYTTARFSLPLKLAGPSDTLRVIVADNVLNRSITELVVRPEQAGGMLVLESLLVYPNPVRSEARFTFSLNRPGSVRARVFTLQGRMIRDLGETPAGFGYNEIVWDGRDQDGAFPGNGVYLLQVGARADGLGGAQAVSRRERFLVLR